MIDDGIRLGAFKPPELRVVPGVCRGCGATLLGMGSLCVVCMQAAWRQETLVQQGDLLRGRPEQRLEVARDKAQQRHVALIGYPAMGFCGTRLTESKKKRLHVRQEAFPPAMCPACLEKLDEARRGEEERR